MKRKWAKKKEGLREAEQNAKNQARQATKDDYTRRKKAGRLTTEELRREERNKERQQSRAKWREFCSDLNSNLLLRDIAVSMRKGVEKRRPTLEQIIKIAVKDFGFTITEKRLVRLKRILGSV